MVVKQENNKLSLIKEENNKKIEKYEILLNKLYSDIPKLKMENNKLYMDYHKKSKKIKKVINIGGISTIVILTMPIASQSLLAAISLSGYFLGELALSQKSIENFIYISDNNEYDEVNKLETFKSRIENLMFVREILKAILNNEYIAISELENICNIFSDESLFPYFSDNEYKILNDYIEKYIEKEKVKIKK